jgi:phosphate transport system substrate-binding protein
MYFKEEVIQFGQKGNTEEFSKGTLLLTSSQAIVEEVANNEAAIGYLGMGYLSDRTKPVRVSRISNLVSRISPPESRDSTGETRTTRYEQRDTSDDFYPPTVQNVVDKTYPLSRPLYLYTDGEPQGVVKLFIDFTLSPMGQTQFMETGFVPVGATVAQEN